MAITWNPSDKGGSIALSNGNLTATGGNADNAEAVRATASNASGKIYWEIRRDDQYYHQYVGIGTSSASLNTFLGSNSYSYGYHASSGSFWHSGVYPDAGDIWMGDGDIIGIALDLDAGKIWFSKNNVWQDGGNPAAGTGENFSGISGTFFPMWAGKNDGVCTVRFSISDQTYSPPTGFIPLEPPTNLLDGKIRIKDTTTDLLDGEISISPHTDLLDGKVRPNISTTNLLDGKVRPNISTTNLLDGKIRIKDTTTDLLDGKAQIKDKVTNLLDGKVRPNISTTYLLDGATRIFSDTRNLLDGKARIKSTATNLLDGKARIKSTATNLLDGKARIKSTATNLLDGLIIPTYTGQISATCPTPICAISAVFRYARIEASPPIPTASFIIGKRIQGDSPVPDFTCSAYFGRNSSLIANSPCPTCSMRIGIALNVTGIPVPTCAMVADTHYLATIYGQIPCPLITCDADTENIAALLGSIPCPRGLFDVTIGNVANIWARVPCPSCSIIALNGQIVTLAGSVPVPGDLVRFYASLKNGTITLEGTVPTPDMISSVRCLVSSILRHVRGTIR